MRRFITVALVSIAFATTLAGWTWDGAKAGTCPHPTPGTLAPCTPTPR